MAAWHAYNWRAPYFKGLFLINPDPLRSAVTQYEFVGAVHGISERFLLPLLEGMLLSFPFRVLGFPADNASRRDAPAPSTSTTGSPGCWGSCAWSGSPSPARATPTTTPWWMPAVPAGCRNAQVARRWFGHDHIPRRFAADVNPDRSRSAFAQGTLSPFLNFHRPCLFATEYRDAADRIRRKYLARDVATPYARFRSLPGAEHRLKRLCQDGGLLRRDSSAETRVSANRLA